MTSNAFLVLSGVTSTAVSILPGSVQSTLHTLFSSTQALLAERWELRALAIAMMLPTAFVALFLASLAVALLWPFTFLALTIGGTALVAWYLFSPTTYDVKTSVASLTHTSAALRMVLTCVDGLWVWVVCALCSGVCSRWCSRW